jgi:hypothetical protein
MTVKLARFGLIVALSLASPALSMPRPSPPPPGAAGPEAFVRWTYGRYIENGPAFDGQAAYSRGLKALFARNAKLLHGEVGDNNDSDPVCQCQDWYTIRITHLSLTPNAGGRSEAEVAFANGETHDAVKLELLLTPSGWRIDDVIHNDPGGNPSLRASLVDENRRLACPGPSAIPPPEWRKCKCRAPGQSIRYGRGG